MFDEQFGIYVHAPWCASRCRYCAFSTAVLPAGGDGLWAAWAEGLAREWELRRAAFPGRPHSIYLGGGTPSLAPPDAVARILDVLPRDDGVEVTLETNPGTVNEDRLAAFRDAGVNRVSLGVQTLQRGPAAHLGRSHTPAQALAAAQLVAAAGLRSWSVDLMFALPGENRAHLRRDLDAIEGLGPPHVSLYGLTWEPGTPLHRDRAAGRVQAPGDDAWRRQYDLVVERLEDWGRQRYEVSNFAVPGHRSVHNEATWRGGCYAGLGPAAHGFLPDGRRTRAHPTFDAWRADLLGRTECPNAHQAALDHVLSTLRHVDGLSLARLGRRTGHEVDEGTVAALTHAGLLIRDGRVLRLTSAGFPVADGVVARLCTSLRQTGDILWSRSA